jgi:hypothetical protein
MKDRSSFPHDPLTFPALEWGISRKEKNMNEENGSQTGVRKEAWTSWKWVFPTVVAMLMIQNLVWAAGYNLVALPLAAGVLAPFNFLLSPAVGAILMSLSTIIVAINATLLRVPRRNQ